MGKASSSKKVQRAARAAASSRGAGERRELAFPLIVLLVVVLGSGLVVAARTSRDPIVAPLISDHWHSAYEFYDCGQVRPAIQDQTDPVGIHTHGDGLFHIHPFNSSATGNDARFGVFLDSAGLTVTPERIRTSSAFDAGFAPIDNSTGCGGDSSEIVVGRWNVDGSGGLELEAVIVDDFRDIRFLHDREAFTIAKVPVGEDPPAPSAAVLAVLDANTGTTNLFSPDFELPALSDDDEGDSTGDDGTSPDDPPAGDDAVIGDPAGDDAVIGGPAGDDAVIGGPAGDDAVIGGPAGDDAVIGGPAGDDAVIGDPPAGDDGDPGDTDPAVGEVTVTTTR